jgi:hypothetical protein
MLCYRIPMRVADVAWAAGIVDGEGSVTLDKKGKTYRQPALTVYSTDLPIIDTLHRLFGGIVQHVPIRANMRKPGWFWKLCGAQCLPCLKILLPYMRCSKKRERAKFLLANWRRVVTPNGRYTDKQKVARLKVQEDFFLIQAA